MDELVFANQKLNDRVNELTVENDKLIKTNRCLNNTLNNLYEKEPNISEHIEIVKHDYKENGGPAIHFDEISDILSQIDND